MESVGRKTLTSPETCPENRPFAYKSEIGAANSDSFGTSEKTHGSAVSDSSSRRPERIFATSARVMRSSGRNLSDFPDMIPFSRATATYGAYQESGETSENFDSATDVGISTSAALRAIFRNSARVSESSGRNFGALLTIQRRTRFRTYCFDQWPETSFTAKFFFEPETTSASPEAAAEFHAVVALDWEAVPPEDEFPKYGDHPPEPPPPP